MTSTCGRLRGLRNKDGSPGSGVRRYPPRDAGHGTGGERPRDSKPPRPRVRYTSYTTSSTYTCLTVTRRSTRRTSSTRRSCSSGGTWTSCTTNTRSHGGPTSTRLSSTPHPSRVSPNPPHTSPNPGEGRVVTLGERVGPRDRTETDGRTRTDGVLVTDLKHHFLRVKLVH